MDIEDPNEGTVDTSLTGMEKPCKLFITIDKEGFLIDSVAISDVVNFDCYESITRSAQRIIALFSNSKPDDIHIVSLFYYKKRARSTRMNPVPLLTTTDGFRAVAEHPTGEVPLGVDWLKKVEAEMLLKSEILTKQTKGVKEYKVSEKEKKNEKKIIHPAVPEKKRKVDTSSNYKTYMPTVTEIVVEPDRSSRSRSPQDGSLQADESGKLPLHVSAKEMFETDARKSTKSSKTNYHWTNDVTCEVVLSYDGVSERRKLPPNISEIVQSLTKGDYSAIKTDHLKNFHSDVTLESQDLLNDANLNYPSHGKQKPITMLSEAKLEIFRILSLLQLSKTRFKDLLSWMKTLKLEEGKQGKFYLSERNVIGGGLKINYDTDEQAAAKLSLIHKHRLKSNQNKVLHPIVPIPPQTNAATSKVDVVMTNSMNSQSDHFVRPLMLMMPGSSSGTVPTNASTTSSHSGQSLIPLTVLQQQIQSTPTSSKEKESFSASTQTMLVKNSHRSSSSPSTSASSASSVTTRNSENRMMKVPNILRNKLLQAKSHKLTPPAEEPVPMHLYRSYHSNDSSADKSVGLEKDTDPTLPIIKQEPVDTNSDNSGDFDKTSDGDPGEGYNNVLKTDDRMLLGVDNPELDMDLVIKTEPMDDY